MPMDTLIEYSDNYSKTSGCLWHYYSSKLLLNANGAIADFLADNNNSSSFNFNSGQNR